jgi:hypothetical protein
MAMKREGSSSWRFDGGGRNVSLAPAAESKKMNASDVAISGT